MKKITYFIGAFALLLNSCSHDIEPSYPSLDDPSNPSNPSTSNVLLKKRIDSDGTETNYTYNGNKIVSAIDNSSESDAYFTYTGDLITKIEDKLSNGIVEETENFYYDAQGKITSYVRLDHVMAWGNKEVYVYNADGTISVSEYIGDLTSQTQLNGTSKIYFTNGEVTKIEEFSTGGQLQTTQTFVHDSANGPMKNVIGIGKLAFISGIVDSISHNLTLETLTGSPNTTYSYTFNTQNYPITCLEVHGSDQLVSQFFY